MVEDNKQPVKEGQLIQNKNMTDPKLNIILPESGEIDFDTPINTNDEEVNFNDSDVWPVDHEEDIEARGPRDEDCVH